MNILVAPANDAAVMKKRTKRITGARDLTAGEYADMLREDKRRKEEQKRRGREQKKKEREEQRKAGKGRGRGRGHGSNEGKQKLCHRQRLQLVIPESDTATNSERRTR